MPLAAGYHRFAREGRLITQPDVSPDGDPTAPGTPRKAEPGADLASEYWERLRLFAARRLGSTDGADDVAQETLRRVGEALAADRVREPAALPGFIFRTAQHVCQQLHRSTDREARGLGRLAAAGAEADPPDALAGLIAAERRREVRHALLRLSGDDRKILRQLYFEDMEPEAIAREWRLTPGALRVRKHRALKRLSQLLDDQDT